MPTRWPLNASSRIQQILRNPVRPTGPAQGLERAHIQTDQAVVECTDHRMALPVRLPGQGNNGRARLLRLTHAFEWLDAVQGQQIGEGLDQIDLIQQVSSEDRTER